MVRRYTLEDRVEAVPLSVITQGMDGLFPQIA